MNPMILKGIIACLVIMLFAQAWLTVEAMNNEKTGSVFTLFSSEDNKVKKRTIYSSIILGVGVVLLIGGLAIGGKKAYNKKNDIFSML
tara:strand:- start:11663 stop:11926 length:264 start_codon:yes stop_codon:yes gene_type:complete